MASALLARPRPLRGEGVRGYLLRLSEVNGLLPAVILSRELVGAPGTRVLGKERLSFIATNCGVSPDDVVGLGCYALQDAVSTCMHAGQPISAVHYRPSRAAICPRCVWSSGSVRASWELAAQAACPDHGCWLIDRCGDCRAPLSWRRRGVARCRCGSDLRAAATDPAPAEVLALAQGLEERLHGLLDSTPGVEFGFPAGFHRVPLNELLGLFRVFLNARFKAVEGDLPVIANGTDALLREAAVMMLVTRALSAWPDGWQRLLDEVAEAAHQLGSDAARVLQTRSEAVAPFILLERPPQRRSEERPRLLLQSARAHMQARAVNVGLWTVFRACRYAGGDEGAKGLRVLWSTWSEGRVLQSKDAFTPRAAAQILGATGHQLRSVADIAGLRASASEIAVRDVDALLARLRRVAIDSRKRVVPGTVPLSSIGREGGDDFRSVLQDVLAGRLECFRLGVPIGNLNYLCVNAKALAAWRRERNSCCS